MQEILLEMYNPGETAPVHTGILQTKPNSPYGCMFCPYISHHPSIWNRAAEALHKTVMCLTQQT